MGTFLGVPIIRTIIFWGLYWGPPVLGNYHIIIPETYNHDKVATSVCLYIEVGRSVLSLVCLVTIQHIGGI